MDHRTEIWVKGLLAAAALGILLWRDRKVSRLPSRRAGALLALAAAVAVLAWYNFGRFHGGGFVHHWEMFHYFLGSKYFPELGYDGLYAASITAQRESQPDRPYPTYVRDLATNEAVRTRLVLAPLAEVRARFTPERWKEFQRDNDHFLDVCADGYLADIRKDHGYNPTPAWTFVARLFDASLPASRGALHDLALLDPLLLLLAFGALFGTFGSRAGCVALVLFGLGYPWRFDWTGGAFLRCDWLAATLVAAALMRRKRFLGAGLLLGYAAAVRLFPAAFLIGPAVAGLRCALRRDDLRWTRSLFGGFALSFGLLLGAGALAGRGAGAWSEFARNFRKHHATWLTNNVGLENVVLTSPDTVSRRLADFSKADPWAPWQARMEQLRLARRPLFLLFAAAFLAPALAAAWRAHGDETLLFGIAAVFALSLPTCYYWILLVLAALARERRLAQGVLAMSAILFFVDLRFPAFETIYAVMSWLLALLLLAWLVSRALAGPGAAREPVPAPERRR